MPAFQPRNPSMMPRRPFIVVLFLAGNLLAVGCSGTPGLMTYPVTGSVVRGGKPVAEATVTFHPEQPWPEGIHRPLAITDANGQFTLTTIQANDGAPAGDYRVTVELRAKVRVGEEVM